VKVETLTQRGIAGEAREVTVYMQAQRFWIERCFQDARSEFGLAQYE